MREGRAAAVALPPNGLRPVNPTQYLTIRTERRAFAMTPDPAFASRARTSVDEALDTLVWTLDGGEGSSRSPAKSAHRQDDAVAALSSLTPRARRRKP